MTPEELVKLIDENIVGQGTQIDAGSVLPIILKGILDLGGGGSDPLAVKYIEQTRTEAEKAIARENIGAMEMMNVDLEPTDNSGNLVMSGGVKRYVDERTKQEYFLVSTFTGLEGDKKALYYLDTAYDNYEKGFYRYEENEYVPGSITKEFKLLELQSDIVYVSTFAGVAGDTKSLYFLDTAYDTFKKGFYRYVASAGTTPAYFAPLLVFIEVFTDVDTLPTTGISKDTIYRIKDIYYEYEGQRVEKDTLTFYGPGAQALNMACDTTNGLAIETTSQSYQYPLADITDALVAQLITDQLIQVKPTDTDAPMFKLGTDSYGPSGEITEVDGGYKLYHNPTETDGEYIEIGGGDSVELDDITTEEVNGKIQANALIDVTVLPTTDIKAKSLYRLECKRYIYDSAEIPKPQGYKAVTGAAVTIDATGITYGGTTTAWADVTDTYINDLVTANVLAECEFEEAALYKLGADSYVLASLVTEETYWQLWYNPTGLVADYHRIGEECYTKKEVDAIVARIDEDILEIVERINEIEEVAARALVDLNKKKVEKSETTGLYAYTHDGDAQGEMEVKKAIGDNDPLSLGPHASDDNLATELAIRKAIDAAKSVKYVSTFVGVTGDKDVLYYLDTAYDTYTVGFYRFIPAEGTKPARYELIGGGGGDVFTDVDDLPTTGISNATIYRTRDVSYEYEGVQFPKSEIVWYGPGPDCTSMDADDVGVNIRSDGGNRSYPWNAVNDTLIQELQGLNLVAVGVAEADAVFFSHTTTYGPKSGITTIYGDYHIYHNPSQTAGEYIEIGGDAVLYVSTFAGVTGDTSALYYLTRDYNSGSTIYKKGFYRYDGTFQFIGTDVILTVETLPTTNISDSVFYRLVEYHKYDNGWEIPVENTFMSNSPRMVISSSGIEYTDTGSLLHAYTWADVTDALVTGWMTEGVLVNVPLSDRSFAGKFYKKEDGTYDAMNGGTAYVYIRNEYKLYHNPTKSASGYIEVGGASGSVDVDGITTEEVNGKLQANAVIEVTTLPTTGIKKNTLYRLPVVVSSRVTRYELYHNPTETADGWILICGAEDTLVLNYKCRSNGDNMYEPYKSNILQNDALIKSFIANGGDPSRIIAIFDFEVRIVSSVAVDSRAYPSGFAIGSNYTPVYFHATGNEGYQFFVLGGNSVVRDVYTPSKRVRRQAGWVGRFTVEFDGSRFSDAYTFRYEADEIPTLRTVNALIGNRTQYTDDEINQLIAQGFSVNVFRINMTDDQAKLSQLLTNNPNDGPVDLSEARWFIYHSLDNKYYDINSIDIETVSGDRQVTVCAGYDKYKYLAEHIPETSAVPATWTELPGEPSSLDIFEDVQELPTTGITSGIIYRILVDKYKEDGNVLPARPTGYLSTRPAIVIIDETGITDNGTHYAWADITDDQMDFWIIRRQISQVYAADLMTMSTCFRTAANHYVYKDHVTKEQVYELYHNPTETANAYIKIGGEGGSAEVDNVTTEEVNGKVQANAVIEVDSLPTTGIKTKSLYRRMETVYKHDGVEVPNVTIYKVNLNDTIEATPEGMRYKPSGPVVAWNDANIGAVIQQAIADDHVETTTWDNAEFFAFGDGEYDYENHFSRILPGSLWQNRTGAAAGWEEVGGEQPVDEVTIVEEHGILKAIAVIDVTTLPSAGMKVNSLYRKVETVMVPGMHIYTTYYHGGNDPVPEPVECYKPARAGVEFRTNEIYIDGVEHSYEELRAYRELWVQMGYIVACDFLDIDTTTNDGAVGYPNEGSYQFLNRERYTYDTDPVPVVMNKIFQRTPGGEWESISTVQISQAAYNALDYTQKMDGTTYIVEG